MKSKSPRVARAARASDPRVTAGRDGGLDFRAIADALPTLLWIADPGGEAVFFNRSWYEYTGRNDDAGHGLDWLDAVHPDDRSYAREAFRSANERREPFSRKYRLRRHDGTFRWVVDEGRPRFHADGSFLGLVGAAAEIHDHSRSEGMAEVRARQQQVVAELGTFALRNLTHDSADMQALMDRTAQMAADTLDIEYAKVLELLPGGEYVLLRAGVGWQEGLVGDATVDTGVDSQAGYTLLSDEPVVVKDLRKDSRFRGPRLLIDHGVVSGMSCVIIGADGQPWGVLGAHTTSRREFTSDDVHFLQALANLLGAALQRQSMLDALSESEERLRAVLGALPVGVLIADARGKILLTNAAVHELWNVPPDFHSWEEYGEFVAWWPESGERIQAHEWAMTRALLDGHVTRGELILGQKFGSDEKRYFLNHAAPVRNASGTIIGGVVAALDVTERRAAEQTVRENKEQLEQRVQERTRQVRQLAATLLRAEQSERARLAQVLHDDIQQLLYALKIQLRLLDDAIGDDGVDGHLADVLTMMQRAIDSTRSLALSMNPPVLREEGLAAALRWLASEMAENYSLEVDLDLDLDESDSFRVEERALVLHTTRELLFNVVKHAGVDRVEIRGRFCDGDLVVEVQDGGSGFDLEEALARKSQSFGLGNIRERLHLNDGRLEIHTKPGHGTRAVIRLSVSG